jgi:serum/glucocorticoid-regulated kinase 2
MYEMLVGIPPFYDRTNDAIFHNIQNAKLKIPSKLSRPAKDLIIGLLQRNPEKRLGYNSSTEVKSHAFFTGMDWEMVRRKELKMPAPRLRNHENPENYTTARFEKHSDPKSHIIGWSFIKG